MDIVIKPIGFVSSGRTQPLDDGWAAVDSSIELISDFDEESLSGLEEFSHIEVIYYFHLADRSKIVAGAEHPRENSNWPKVGIFAQRKKSRPNLLGATISRLIKIEGRRIFLSSLDAIDGTPVIDIKPVMKEFLPREQVVQPVWSKELMMHYW